jgi:hypothetical protein
MKEEQPYNSGAETRNHLDEIEIAAYADYLCGFGEDVPEDVKLHTEDCQACRSEVMETADMIRLLERQGRKSISKRWKAGIRAAAALVSVFILALIIQRISNNPHEPLSTPSDQPQTITPTKPNTPITPTPTTPTTTTTTTTPSPFTPNPAYETLIGATWRGAENPGAKGPVNDTLLAGQGTISVTWDAGFKDEFRLVIVNNQGVEVMSLSAVERGRIVCEVDLPDGLYYWKLLGKKEVWGVGRMRVEE